MATTIGHLIASNFFGGPERQVYEHLKELRDSDRYAGVAFSFLEERQSAPLVEKCREAGIGAFPLRTPGSYNPRQIDELAGQLAANKVDLLCAHGYRSIIIGLAARRRRPIPVVGFSRGWTKDNLKVRLFNIVDRLSLRFVDHIVAVSHGQRKRLLQYNLGYPEISVVHNCIDTGRYEAVCDVALLKDQLEIPHATSIIGCVGRLSREKGHRYLLDALRTIRGMRSDFVCVIVGDGPDRHLLEKQAKQLGINDNVRFLGFRSDTDSLMNMFDMLVLPSEQEGLPNVVLEAFAAKKPVVATAVGGVPEVVEEGRSGFLVPPCRPDALASAIAKCLAGGVDLEHMGTTGYNRVKNEFNFQRQAVALGAVYRQVLSGRGKR